MPAFSAALARSQKPDVDAGGALCVGAEHVRMAADHFRRHRLDDVAEGECTLLLGHARVIDDLQQEVAELVLEMH